MRSFEGDKLIKMEEMSEVTLNCNVLAEAGSNFNDKEEFEWEKISVSVTKPAHIEILT